MSKKERWILVVSVSILLLVMASNYYVSSTKEDPNLSKVVFSVS